MTAPSELPESRYWAPKAVHPAVAVFAAALTLRLVFGRLIANTYDYDEFVLLLLARDFAGGAVPYRDFMFFHPPGALVLLREIAPITALWWPLARIAMSVIDAVTATLIFYIGVRVFDLRTGFAAGIAYAASPLALISGVRVGQDPLVTALGTAAILLLTLPARKRWAVAAGVCLGAAVWVKYPAAYFIPICLLVAPRRFGWVALGTVVTLAALFAPFIGDARLLYSQTVTFQHSRWTMALDQRLLTGLLFWLGANLLALRAVLQRQPLWLVAGFALGGAFILAPQVYYHYFVPVLPCGALLTARALSRLRFRWRPVLLAVAAGTLAWAAVLDAGGRSPLYITAARLSEVQPTVGILARTTSPGQSVLADRYEYAFLSGRQSAAHYFWNVGVLVNARYLERRLRTARAVVLSSGASSGYPTGFAAYLNARFPRLVTPTTTVWILRSQLHTR